MIYNSSKNLGLCCRCTFLSRDSWCTLTTYCVLHKGGGLGLIYSWWYSTLGSIEFLWCYLPFRSPCWLDRFVHPLKVGIWILGDGLMEQLQRVSFTILGTWEEQWIIGQSLRTVFWPKAAVLDWIWRINSKNCCHRQRHESSFSLWRRRDAAQGPRHSQWRLRMLAVVGTKHSGFPLPTPSREANIYIYDIYTILVKNKTPTKHQQN